MTRGEQQRTLSGSGAGRIAAAFDYGGSIPVHVGSAVPVAHRGVSK